MKTMFDLRTGDSIQAYMRQSIPLEIGRTPKGLVYRFVPRKPRKASPRGLSRFNGTVVSNDTINRIITVNTVAIDYRRVPMQHSPSCMAEISYTAFSRVFLLSAYHLEPRVELRRGGNEYRPTTNALGTNFKPYRTMEAIHIPQ